ncbi:MAG: hypothetical protein LC754_02805 [Acidobacteria bacterium]|nr:hypothetical protein [Acidobacteriota bacterium]
MSKLSHPPQSGATNARRIFSAVLLLSFVLCSWLQGFGVNAQSGRRRAEPARPSSPPPADTATQGESESESKPRGSATKPNASVLVNFVVMEDDNMIVSIPYGAREIVNEGFLRRLKQSRAVAVEGAGKAGRKEARDRAKKEKDAFVVLLQVEEDAASSGQQSIGRADTRTLVINIHVYAPVTGDLKFTDRVWQRPYRQTATIGGVRVPVPVSRRSERFPSEYQLEQASRDAADRLMSRFNVIPPPEN